jgi:hypothetical protein
MIIIPNNLYSTIYPSAQDTKVLVKDSEEFCQLCEKSLTRKSKTTLLRTWLRRLKKGDYIQLLFSRTLKPSHTESFLEKYLSSVEDSHVSPLVQQVLEKLPMTQDICIPSSQKESHSANQLSFFSKMSVASSQQKPTMENPYSTMSAETWKAEVTKCRGEYSQRVKSAYLIKEKGSSSWDTPRVGGVDESWETAAKRGRTSNLYAQMDKVMNYPTPTTSDAEGGKAEAKIDENGRFYRENKKGERWSVKLRDAVETFSKPKNWGTPKEQDSRAAMTDRGKHNLGEQVHGMYNQSQDQTNHNTNGNTQESLLKRYLNPNWVEQLMGLEIGTTDLGYVGTELSQQSQPKHL